MSAEESREAMWERMATERKAKEGKQEPVIENIIEPGIKLFQLWNPNISPIAFVMLMDKPYTKADIGVYGYLTFNMDIKSGRTKTVSREDIGTALTVLSERQILRSLHRLVDTGLIEPKTDAWKSRNGATSFFVPDSYKAYQARKRVKTETT